MVTPITDKENKSKAPIEKKIIKQIKAEENKTLVNKSLPKPQKNQKSQKPKKSQKPQEPQRSQKPQKENGSQNKDKIHGDSDILQNQGIEHLREVFIWSEILGKPVSKRRHRR